MSYSLFTYLFALMIFLNICIADNSQDFPMNHLENSGVKTANEKLTLDLNANNHIDCGLTFAGNIDWVNASDRVILSELDWTPLSQISSDIRVEVDNAVFINFTCDISDKVLDFFGASVSMRLMRDNVELTSRTINLQTNTHFYHDMSLALNFTDTPGRGQHNYRVEYKIDSINLRALVTNRNLQVIEIKKTRGNK